MKFAVKKSPQVLVVPPKGEPMLIRVLPRATEAAASSNVNPNMLDFLSFLYKCLFQTEYDREQSRSFTSSTPTTTEPLLDQSSFLSFTTTSPTTTTTIPPSEMTTTSQDPELTTGLGQGDFRLIDHMLLGDVFAVGTRLRKDDARQFMLYCAKRIGGAGSLESLPLNESCLQKLHLQVYGTAVIVCWRMNSVRTVVEKDQKYTSVRYYVDRIVSWHGTEHLDLCRKALDRQTRERRQWFRAEAVQCPPLLRHQNTRDTLRLQQLKEEQKQKKQQQLPDINKVTVSILRRPLPSLIAKQQQQQQQQIKTMTTATKY